MTKKTSLPWLVPSTVGILICVLLLSAVYRLMVTEESLSSGVLPDDPGDVPYVRHPYVAFLHLVPGMAFILLGPFQFVSAARRRWPVAHRWSGRVFVVSGVLIGLTGITMNAVFPPVGGLLKASAVYVFGVAQIVALVVAVGAILRRDVPRHRAWMIRSFAIGLSVATQRLFFVPVFFLYGVPSERTIGMGMWVGFLLHIAAAELILHRERHRLAVPVEPAHVREG